MTNNMAKPLSESIQLILCELSVLLIIMYEFALISVSRSPY